MKKHLLFLVAVLFCFFANAQEQSFLLNGTIPVSPKKFRVLLSWNNGATAEEANVVNGKFIIKGEVSEPVAATLNLQEVNPPAGKAFNRLEMEQNTLYLFLDGGVITVQSKTNLWDAVVKGSPVVNDFQEYQVQIRKLFRLESKMGEVFDAYMKEKNQNAANGIFKLYEQMADLYYNEQLAFVKKHTASPVSLYLTEQALGNSLESAKAAPLFELLSDALQKSEKGRQISEMIEVGKKSMVGVTATDFSQPTPDGTNISLSSFRGKYVLVDFWASWCGPCRAESPNLVKAYNQYKSKGFEIYSVSMDEKKDRWLKAIKDDNYTWPQAGDLKGWDNAAGALFGVSSIPFNFLVDPNGVIIARNLRGEELDKKLKELFK
jgi:thiol-disulfide isomerase/thioredoxin